MIENPNEGLQVPENYLEVFTESLTTKPEVPAPPQAEIEKSYFTKANAKHSLFCWAWYLRLLTITCCPVAKYQFASYQHFGARPPLLCCIIRVGSFFEMAWKSLQRLLGSALLGFSLYLSFLLIYDKGNWNLHSWKKNGMIGCKNAEPSNGGEGLK